MPHVVLFIVRVSDYDICGLSPSLMSLVYRVIHDVPFIVSMSTAVLSQEMLRLTGRNKKDTIPQDSAS
jgi:hypothetical protein